MDPAEYKDIFLAEAQEYLQLLNTSLLQLEHNPGNIEILQEMFRAAHSLKGMSATMGYQLLATLAHQMENVLDLLRSGNLQATRAVANLLFESLDLIESLLGNLDEPALFSGGADRLIEKLRMACSNSDGGESSMRPGKELAALDEFEKEVVREASRQGLRARGMEVVLEQTCLLKSVRAFMVFKTLEKFGHVVKTLPGTQEIDEEHFEDRFQVIFLTAAADGEIRSELVKIAEVAAIDLFDVNVDREASHPAVLETQDIQAKNNDSGEPGGDAQKKSTKRAGEKTIRVETEKLDKLINLVGELVVNRTRVIELARDGVGTELSGSIEQLDRITTELQSSVMKLRMVPLKQVFDRLPRMVRDLSQETGKKVEFSVLGEETELDRSIVNQIGDPLVHLLRNAVDHGIEPPSERVRLGKNETAEVVLEARHEGSYVLVRVSDDGRGINPEIMRRKAVEKGLFSPADAGRLSDDEALQLIFRNGFSTAEKVTDTSGRGVGMDAVKTVIESMSGSIDIKTTPGHGTFFNIRLPLTLAIIKALLVDVSGEIYAIPIESIRENLYVLPSEIKSIRGEKVINLRSQVLPLVFLDQILGLPPVPPEDVLSVVVVEAADKRAGLVVDVLLGQQEIVIKSLSRVLEYVRGVAGATVLGSGKVALILDVSALI